MSRDIISVMTELLLILIFAVLGLVFGSFAGATIWRLRAWQLVQDKKAGEKIDSKEYKRLLPLTKQKISSPGDRSMCLHCQHPLAWYDLIPLASWLSTKGRCRYCKKPIGWFEPIIELVTAVLFVGVYLWWPSLSGVGQALLFGLWLLATLFLVILFFYDAKWFLLPNVITYPLIGVSAVIATERVLSSSDILSSFYSLAGSVLILAGLYFVLYFFSYWRNGEDGTWVGFGDVKLTLALGLLLGDWELALLALFLANLIGCIVVLPGLIAKKLSRKTHVPFGPMLIAGFFIALFFGHAIITWYLQISTDFFMALMV